MTVRRIIRTTYYYTLGDAEIRAGRPITGPEAILRNIGRTFGPDRRGRPRRLPLKRGLGPDSGRSHHLPTGAPYRRLRNKLPTKPYEFFGFGARNATKPYKFTWFSDIHGSKPYKCTRSRWTFISQTPVVPLWYPSASRPGRNLPGKGPFRTAPRLAALRAKM